MARWTTSQSQAFQAAQGFFVDLAFGAFSLVIDAPLGLVADLGDRQDVRGDVQLPVAVLDRRCRFTSPEDASRGAPPQWRRRLLRNGPGGCLLCKR